MWAWCDGEPGQWLANRLRTADTPSLAAQGQSVCRKTVTKVPLKGLPFVAETAYIAPYSGRAAGSWPPYDRPIARLARATVGMTQIVANRQRRGMFAIDANHTSPIATVMSSTH